MYRDNAKFAKKYLFMFHILILRPPDHQEVRLDRRADLQGLCRGVSVVKTQ